MALELRVLGPVAALSDGLPIDLGTAKERALLALLALNAGKVVSADRIADDLWDGAPPAQASATLRVYVSHLRKALSGTISDGELIKTQRPGYLLDVTPDALDATRFEGICRSARAAAAAGDHAGAADSLREALALWRGPALADVADQAFARLEANRLEEARLAALEDRIAADLALGRHAELIGELDVLTAEHPLRERLWAHRITALYRSGRQADALAAYRRLRERLADELGIDPSPELQQLERMVLAQDEALAPVPTREHLREINLPTYRTAFFGRRSEIEALDRTLNDHQLVTVTGVGGCGKTRLAIEAASQLAAGFAHGTYFVDLGSISDADLVLQTIAAGVNMAMGTMTVAARPLHEELRELVRDRRALVVLDNCEHVLEAAAAGAELLIDASRELRVIATSREPFGLDGEHVFAIPSLGLPDDAAPAEADSVRLFVDRAVAARADFRLDSANIAAVADVCRRLDGIPLAIELAAARVSHLSPRQIADRLGDRFRLLTGGRRRVPRQQTLQAAMDWSYDLLTEDDRRFLRRLSVFPAEFSLEAAEQVAGAGLSTPAIDLLGSLIAKSLLTLADDDDAIGYRLPETVRAYAESRLAEAAEGDGTRTAHLEYVLDWIAAQPEEYRTFSIIRTELTKEAPNLLAAVWWAELTQRPQAMATILGSTRLLWSFMGGWETGANVYERALAVESQLERRERVLLLGQAAGMTFFLNRYDEAVAHSSKAVALGDDDDGIPFIEALFIHASLLAPVDPDAARGHMDRALELAERFGPAAVGTVSAHYGEACMMWRDYSGALGRYEIASKLGEEFYTSHWGRFGMALAYDLLGEVDPAIAASGEAMSYVEAWQRRSARYAEPFMSLMTKFSRAITLAHGGRTDDAKGVLRSLVADMDRRRVPFGLETGISACAIVRWYEDDPAGASRLFGRSGPAVRCLSAGAVRNHYLGLVREALGPELARKCRAEGEAMSIEDAIAEALGS